MKKDLTLLFPLNGKHVGFPATVQPEGTTPDCNNVRPSAQSRTSGVQRPAIVKWGDGTQIGAAEQPVVAMCIVPSIM